MMSHLLLKCTIGTNIVGNGRIDLFLRGSFKRIGAPNNLRYLTGNVFGLHTQA
jgi:hypothetical protein